MWTLPMLPKKLRYKAEYILMFTAIKVTGILPFSVVSGFGALLGMLAATLPLSACRVARENLQRVFPHKSEQEIRRLQFRAFVNLGRTLLELPKVYSMSSEEFSRRVEITGMENLKKPEGGLLLTAHLGNWEIICRMLGEYNIPFASVYRKANNAEVDALIVGMRSRLGGIQIPKGTAGARELVKAVKENLFIGMLNDQKMNDGIQSRFLDQPAMTAPALASLALKYEKAVIPVFCVRKKRGKFVVSIHQPIFCEKNINDAQDVKEYTDKFNEMIGEQVLAHPEQWLWMHRRFMPVTG